MTQGHTVITGTTRTYGRDGALIGTLPSPRVTLDAHGGVATEERLSAAGGVALRRQFTGGRLVAEEQFAADGQLDERVAYRYDASGRLAEEVMVFGDGTTATTTMAGSCTRKAARHPATTWIASRSTTPTMLAIG
jgi:YD repeat-containing protein